MGEQGIAAGCIVQRRGMRLHGSNSTAPGLNAVRRSVGCPGDGVDTSKEPSRPGGKPTLSARKAGGRQADCVGKQACGRPESLCTCRHCCHSGLPTPVGLPATARLLAKQARLRFPCA